MSLPRHMYDPKAPKPPRVRPGPPDQLPVARMRRLGISQRAFDVVTTWWDSVDVPTRVKIVERWAVTPDVELDMDLASIDRLFEASGPQTATWLARQPDQAVAARLALVVEHRRDPPRATVLATLNKVAGQ